MAKIIEEYNRNATAFRGFKTGMARRLGEHNLLDEIYGDLNLDEKGRIKNENLIDSLNVK